MHPWPEEFNRVTIDSISRLLFAPTEQARINLLAEYNSSAGVFVTGNTGIDAVLDMSARIDHSRDLKTSLERKYPGAVGGKSLILVTGHRRESFGEGFRRICEGLMRLSRREDVELIYPVHLNPNVRGVVNEMLCGKANIHLIEPVEYADMVFLMKAAKVIITDSGGVQEEGPALGKPVLVMRDVTERPEALATGVVKLIGTDPERMQTEVESLLDDAQDYAARARRVFPYGDGTASMRIASIIEREFFQ
jgi:UDP-N-acetylglucosamine 2-epimerase